jgi:hypothetical protein
MPAHIAAEIATPTERPAMRLLPSDRLDTVIDIAAPPAAVWRVLTDFAGYAAWNPFIRQAEGQARAGARLSATMHPTGRKPMTFRPVITRADTGVALVWRGRLPIPGLFGGEHAFLLAATATGTRLDHSESFRGLLVPFLKAEVFRKDFEAMNAALKARVEKSTDV